MFLSNRSRHFWVTPREKEVSKRLSLARGRFDDRFATMVTVATAMQLKKVRC